MGWIQLFAQIQQLLYNKKMETSNQQERDHEKSRNGNIYNAKLFLNYPWECIAHENGILICSTQGWGSKSDTEKLESTIDDVIGVMDWIEKPWVLIYDCSKLPGMDIAARGKLIDLLLSLKNLKCVVFSSPSHLIRSLFQLFETFYNPKFRFCMCNDINESYRKGCESLGLMVETSSQNGFQERIEKGVDENGNQDINAVLKILCSVQWNKPGIKSLEDVSLHSPWKPFLNIIAIIKGDLDVMLQKREERFAQLEQKNLEEVALQQKMSEALEASRNAKNIFEQESRRNIMLTRVVVDTQKEILFSMGEIIESRSRETANHIRRVAEYSSLLGKLYDLSEREQLHLLHTSPMHDAGKIAIPDTILNKPGKLTDEEFAIMKEHARIGWQMLKGSQLEIMQLAAVIANQHHERWNGKGYPGGLKGEGIHIYGRIVALADVFDALGSDRCYKKAWAMDKILELLYNERGEQFDPALIDLFLSNIDSFIAIKERFPDAAS
ncbi:MAG: HD domain-containing protein [Chitinispirillaceae bacterium]|nr:HD domain-containing protein [Chitinispirillaceae bacterium]